MRIKFLKTLAGPAGTWTVGTVAEVTDELAEAWIGCGAAEALTPLVETATAPAPAPEPVIETATAEPEMETPERKPTVKRKSKAKAKAKPRSAKRKAR